MFEGQKSGTLCGTNRGKCPAVPSRCPAPGHFGTISRKYLKNNNLSRDTFSKNRDTPIPVPLPPFLRTGAGGTLRDR